MSETPHSEQPEAEKKLFKIAEFLIEPVRDYRNLIEQNEKESNLEKWERDGLFTSFGVDLAE